MEDEGLGGTNNDMRKVEIPGGCGIVIGDEGISGEG
jgi:hypothetical protein